MKKTMKIEWYKKCLSNSIDYALDLESQLFSLQKRVNELNKSNAFLSLQINEAKKRGIKEFDNDRFMVKRVDK